MLSTSSACDLHTRDRVDALDNLGADRQLIAGTLERLDGSLVVHTAHLEHHAARLHDGHPVVDGALALTHTGLGSLLCDGLVGEDADVDLPTALELAHDRTPRSLDLASSDPGGLQCHEANIAKVDLVATRRLAGHPPAKLLTVLDSLRL